MTCEYCHQQEAIGPCSMCGAGLCSSCGPHCYAACVRQVPAAPSTQDGAK